MFHSRKLHQKINKIQERALRITFQDFESSFEVLLEKDSSLTVHQRNLQFLMTEMYKTKSDLYPVFMKEIFCENENHYNLWNGKKFSLPRFRTVRHGSEFIRFRGQQALATVLHIIKCARTLKEFKRKIKCMAVETCQCRLCQTFVPNLGFI